MENPVVRRVVRRVVNPVVAGSDVDTSWLVTCVVTRVDTGTEVVSGATEVVTPWLVVTCVVTRVDTGTEVVSGGIDVGTP